MTDVTILRGGSIKVSDTKPALRVQLMENGSPFDLTKFDVDMSMKLAGDESLIVDNSVSVEQATRGIVRYEWGSGETQTPGTYHIEFVAHNNEHEITFPNSGTGRVYIEERL